MDGNVLKIKIFILCIVLSFTSPTFAALPNGSCEFDVNLPRLTNPFLLSGTLLWLRPSTPSLDYAIEYPDFSFSGGDYNNIRPGHDWGYSAMVGYAFPCSANDVRFSFTLFNSSDTGFAAVPDRGVLVSALGSPFVVTTVNVSPLFDAGFIPTFTSLGGITISPVGVISIITSAANAQFVNATANFKNNTYNLDFSQYVNIDTQFRLRWFSGLQYSLLRHNFNASYQLQSINTGTIAVTALFVTITAPTTVMATEIDTITQSSKFDGIGPHFGTEGSLHIGNGFGLFGSLSTAVLVGKTTSSITDVGNVTTIATLDLPDVFDVNTATSFASFTASMQSKKHTRIVPNFRGEIGIDYSVPLGFDCNCNYNRLLTISLGYQVDYFFNSIDRLAVFDIAVPERRSMKTFDTSFQGPFLRLDFRL